ncbi:MAG: thiosulfate oxidation carrier protein SoxY [Gammaproteobacteria bacterium]|nr:thiosulfate oxidation carrier protein SoxY [Gammaproteobacteria bacterium]
MNSKRRTLLKGSLAAGAVGVAASAGLLAPRSVLAAWPKSAFSAKGIDASLSELYGSGDAASSSSIKLKAPDIAENGAVVPVTVSSSIKNAESISIFVAKNPQPLTSSYALGSATDAYVATRIKMGKTSDVVAVVKAGGKLYSAKKEVKVTIGGCGG